MDWEFKYLYMGGCQMEEVEDSEGNLAEDKEVCEDEEEEDEE